MEGTGNSRLVKACRHRTAQPAKGDVTEARNGTLEAGDRTGLARILSEYRQGFYIVLAERLEGF